MAADIGEAAACTAVAAVGIAEAEVAGIAAGAVDIAGEAVVGTGAVVAEVADKQAVPVAVDKLVEVAGMPVVAGAAAAH